MRFLIVLPVMACGAGDVLEDDEAIALGRAVYAAPLPDGNTFACATCHALSEPAADGIRRPGHPLNDAFARNTWKNGAADSLLAAVNSCQEEWMNAEPWASGDDSWRAVEALLASLAPETAAPLSFEVIQPGDVSGGDASAGEGVFEFTCVACHSTDASPTLVAPSVLFLGLEPDYIARRVRSSGRIDGIYDGLTGGVMPFWSADRLSEQELRDVVAFVSQSESDILDTGDTGDTGSLPVDTPPCATADHAKVGQIATLLENFHDVAGTAEIIDDCSIRITDFVFDGTGVDVRFYGGTGGDYSSGFSMSEVDLRRTGGYAGDTLYATLPAGRTWDDVDGLSVWCVPVGVDFGSGLFSP